MTDKPSNATTPTGATPAAAKESVDAFGKFNGRLGGSDSVVGYMIEEFSYKKPQANGPEIVVTEYACKMILSPTFTKPLDTSGIFSSFKGYMEQQGVRFRSEDAGYGFSDETRENPALAIRGITDPNSVKAFERAVGQIAPNAQRVQPPVRGR